VDPSTGKLKLEADGSVSKEFIYDIACAELCGWGHYRMIGRIYVHKDEADFIKWLEFAEKNNQLRTRSDVR
jgi:heme/copper-type cytochrome/quinol oxidase subunit 2